MFVCGESHLTVMVCINPTAGTRTVSSPLNYYSARSALGLVIDKANNMHMFGGHAYRDSKDKPGISSTHDRRIYGSSHDGFCDAFVMAPSRDPLRILRLFAGELWRMGVYLRCPAGQYKASPERDLLSVPCWIHLQAWQRRNCILFDLHCWLFQKRYIVCRGE